MGKAVKITAIALASLIGAMLLAVGIYVLYVVCQYSRIEDNVALTVENNRSETLDAGGVYSIMTYNMGFGAYSPDYTFFMDAGIMADGSKTRGKYGKAVSRAAVERNLSGTLGVIAAESCDFVFVQEVDENASRSHHVNQRAAVSALDGYGSVYAENFHSAYLFYPFNDPHGKSDAGIVTLSKYAVTSAVRRSFPLADGFSKYLDLDRCFSVSRLDAGDRELVLIHLHMSAYDKGGVIRAQQLSMLNAVLRAEYEAGNYVIAGGDFNHDIANSDGLFPSKQQKPDWLATFDAADLAEGYAIAAATNAPSCRGCDIAYEKDVTYTVVVDGFMVSDNIEVIGVENKDLQFAYSDHNPVVMRFRLKA